MNRKKKKIILAAVIGVIGAVILGFLVSALYGNLALKNQLSNSHDKLTLINQLIEESKDSEESITTNYDEQYTSKADTVAFAAKNLKSFKYTDEYLEDIREIIDVDYIAVKDKNDKTICEAGKAVDSSEEPREYTSEIDGNYSIYINNNSESLQKNLNENASLEYVLDGIKVGQNGFAFAVHAVKETIIFYPDSALVGDMAKEHDIDISLLVSGTDPVITIDGIKYQCSVTQIDNGLIACAVPVSELTANKLLTVVISLIIYAVLMAIIIMFSAFLHDDDFRRENEECDDFEEKEKRKALAGQEKKNAYNRFLGRRIIAIAVCGVILAFAVTFYIQSLVTLSKQSVTNNKRCEETVETLKNNDNTISVQSEEYNDEYLEKVRIAAFVIQNADSKQLTKDFMTELRDKLGVDSLQYFGTDGKIIAADTDLWSYTISSDEEDQSYAFWSVLDGTKQELIQETQRDDEGNLKQYVGRAVLDDDHKTIGMVEMSATPEALEKALLNTDTATVLKGIRPGNNGFAFAIDKETKKFIYFPDTEISGADAERYGMTENQLVGNYNDFVKIGGKKYYCASLEYNGMIVYAAVPFGDVNITALPVAALSSIIMLIFMALLWLLFSFNKRDVQEKGVACSGEEDFDVKTAAYEQAVKCANIETTSNINENNSVDDLQAECSACENHEKLNSSDNAADIDVENTENEKQFVDVVLGDGRKTKTRAVGFRWNHNETDWENRTAGQKTTYILNIILTVIAFFIMAAVLFADSIFPEESIIHFILKGEWQKGFNIFSVTYCILIAICIIEIVTIVRRLVMWLAHSMNAKGETICRLVDNFLGFAVVIAIAYYCLGTLGVDTTALWASAGILTLIIGLGAKSLVSDILAGLFIVFESEFQVGDIVTIDSFRGTVIEIGIRTTKIKDSTGNIKIFSNSSVGNVLNMTKDYSAVSCDITVAGDVDIHELEKVLEEEFPNIKEKLPAIVDGPFYRGIAEFSDDAAVVKITAKCQESDRVQLERDLRRQLKMALSKHKINVKSVH